MWNHGAVTDIGRTVLAKAAGGKTLVIDGAQSGTGTVAETELRTCTSLAGTTYVLGVTNYEVKEQGVRFTVQITSPGDGYTVKQIGLFGHVDNEESCLLAIYQDETGIAIPDNVQMPDFMYLFYAEIQMNNSGSISITLDPSVLVSQEQLYEELNNRMPGIINDWLAANIMQETGYVIDDSLTVPGAAADAKKTGDALKALQEETAEIPDIKEDVVALKSAFHGLTDYAGNDFNLNGTPGASDGTCLATKRTGMTVTLNGGNVNQSTASRQYVYLKLTGALGRTINSNTVKAWTDGIQLEAGKLYLVTCKHMSGATTGASYPSISVYNIGSATSIGYAYRDGDTYRRYFTAPDGLVNIILLNPCKDTLYTDYTVFVTLQEVDTTKVPDGYTNINLYPMLWYTGGIGSDGENYARNTSIRTSGYLEFANIYSIAFTAGTPFYLALYDKDNEFLARSDQTGVIFTDVFKHAYPTAKKFRLEMRGVDGDRDAYSNCVIYGKHSIYGFIDKQDTKKEMADVLIQHRTTSEQYGRTNLTALIVTDVHSELQRLSALLAMMEKWGLSYFDAIINCGDTALTLQSNYSATYNQVMAYMDLPKINVVGNHDSYSSLGNVGPQATTYNLVIAPIAEQEGLVQPTDAAANSLCYYYYDVNGIRIIALDCMYWNTAEATWLESVLADAAASSKPVICVSHYGFKEAYAEWIPSLWKPYASYPSDMINIAAAEKVKDFMDGGGTFLCWLVGHSHQDNLYRLKPEYGGQLVVTFPSLAQRAGNVLKNEDIDAYNYSCGTFMAVDLYQHNIRFLRLGADIDTVGVRHRGLSLNYLTGEIFGAWS